MRYAQIRSMDISNGEGVGVSLFVQGCPSPHCKGCFNQETWGFDGGKEWTKKTKEQFMELIDRPYITRVSILGGEPLSLENSFEVTVLCKEIKKEFPDKKIWVYTGNTYENIWWCLDVFPYIDVLVDGRFEEDKKDMTLKFKGSSNQRTIDVQKTLTTNKVELYEV